MCFCRNRDAEAKLMGDVEGWEVGTWYGHKIFKVRCGQQVRQLLTLNCVPQTTDQWTDPTFDEFYIHTSKQQRHKAANLIHWLKWD
jgi:NADH dehydrogenase (ubiquinone) 1 alpha subcomplex subunit 13